MVPMCKWPRETQEEVRAEENRSKEKPKQQQEKAKAKRPRTQEEQLFYKGLEAEMLWLKTKL